jgi:hypothetical protein
MKGNYSLNNFQERKLYKKNGQLALGAAIFFDSNGEGRGDPQSTFTYSY